MSRLEEARAEYAAALAEARDEIVAELEKFGASPAPRLSAARNTPPPYETEGARER